MIAKRKKLNFYLTPNIHTYLHSLCKWFPIGKKEYGLIVPIQSHTHFQMVINKERPSEHFVFNRVFFLKPLNEFIICQLPTWSYLWTTQTLFFLNFLFFCFVMSFGQSYIMDRPPLQHASIHQFSKYCHGDDDGGNNDGHMYKTLDCSFYEERRK